VAQASVVVSAEQVFAATRVMNVNNVPITIEEDEVLAELEEVEILNEKGTVNKIQETAIPQIEELVEGVSNEVTAEQRECLRKLLMEYQDVLSRNEYDLGECIIAEHHIDTGDSRPIKQQMRRQPTTVAAEVEKQVLDMIQAGVIEPSCSPWASNVVMVRKKDGSQRFCIDFRKLNDVTRKDSYPLPRIDVCLDSLAGAKLFSAFDLRSGYHQVRMYEEDADKTSFVTRSGLWRFRRLPFGLSNAGATFQRVMDVAMAGLNFNIMLVYLDDIIVFSKTVDEHLERLRALFDRLRRANLKLKPSKCKLMRDEIGFLGHVVSAEGVRTDEEKTRAVAEWPIPKNLHEVRSFLGLCGYYRRFVQDFAKIAAPLHALAGKNIPFEWTTECQAAFVRLKEKLTSTPILALPQDEGKFILDTDASGVSIGAVLSQEQEGKERVIAYGSRVLSRAERNYCVTRQELLAVVYFLKAYRQFLTGKPFLVRTDHSALQWLRRTPEPIGQQARWLETMEEFQFEVKHRAGTAHRNADALSRRPVVEGDGVSARSVTEQEWDEWIPPFEFEEQTTTEDSFIRRAKKRRSNRRVVLNEPTAESEWSNERLKQAYEDDPLLKEVMQAIRMEGENLLEEVRVEGRSRGFKAYWGQRERLKVENGLLWRKWWVADSQEVRWQLIPPIARRESLIETAHEGWTGGHVGFKKTLKRVQDQAYWFGWHSDVERALARCANCATYFRGILKRQGELQIPCVGEAFERIAIDITGPHPKSRQGYVYILTVIDLFTKWAMAFPVRQHDAVTVASILCDQVFSVYGIPLQILSDQGPEFEGHLMRELCRELRIDKLRTTSYHPSCNGGVERFHRTLNSLLGRVVSENQRDWSERLPAVMAAYRASSHEATGSSPNKLMFGREVNVPIDLALGRPANHWESYSDFVAHKTKVMEEAYSTTRQQLNVTANRSKRYYDMRVRKNEYTVGSWVWYYYPRRRVGVSPKWQRYYQGPYLVTQVLGPVNVRIQRSRRATPLVAHVDKLKRYNGVERESWLSDAGGRVAEPEGERRTQLTEAESTRPRGMQRPAVRIRDNEEYVAQEEQREEGRGLRKRTDLNRPVRYRQ
jgi:transposase InsO family protein